MTIKVSTPVAAYIRDVLPQDFGSARALAFLHGFMRVGLEQDLPALTLDETRELVAVLDEYFASIGADPRAPR